MSQSEIRQAMRSVVFARRGKRQEAASRARYCNERSVEDRDAQNQQRSEPGGNVVGLLEAQLQPERGHQESQEHGPAVAHENLGWLEIPAQKARCRSEDR